jgi:hypothetical protein
MEGGRERREGWREGEEGGREGGRGGRDKGGREVLSTAIRCSLWWAMRQRGRE